ncbi:secretion protein HlyD family protein [Rippkaea orientalis PCC 8801]|uniref:Secretion protein HlyD family protein n=1 Tax=Rippkaea orientalis (strain PCC 8801 / RF-1) TaxID=41431 RepID=B7JYD6_RIPO1|nr:HlyD family efflux transporter periplasmic adaptor subunit [Rippkaea orientalis]ACK67238.1 secretion protein HlyD family protein [Rippkaea orientalis PCC 8801]
MKLSPNSSHENLDYQQPVNGSISEMGSEVSQEDITSIYGGVVGSSLPISSMGVSSAYPLPTPQTEPKVTVPRWSPSVHDLLDQPPASLPQRLIYGGIAFCLAFGTWAWFGTIEEVGHAQGKLIPQGETYKIQPIELGKVKSIEVKAGEEVQAGQVIMELDTELAQKEVEQHQQMLAAYQLELAQQQMLLERVQLEAQTRAAMASAEQNAQRSAIALTQEKIATTRHLLGQQQSEALAYRSRQRQLQPLTSTAHERLEQLQGEVLAHQARLERLKPLEEEGAVSQDYIFQAEQELRQTQQRITQSVLQEVPSTQEQLFQADQSLRDLQRQITENKGDLTAAFKDAERLTAELHQKQAQAEQMQLEAQQKAQELEVAITQLRGKIADTQTLLLAAQAKLKYKFLKAPVDGVVLSLDVKRTGEVIEAGKIVAQVAPNGVPLVLSALLPNREAGFVELGMPVQVKLDAYPYQDYGIVSGQVTKISEDAESDEKLGEVYRVEVDLDRDYIQDNQQKIAFKAGQTGTADIVIRRRRIIDILIDPIKKIQEDGIKL